MSLLFLIFATGVLVVGAFGLYLLLLAWSANHKPAGQKSLADHWADESKFACSESIVRQVKDALLVFTPNFNQGPELDYDAEDAPALALYDEHFGYTLIRTPQMCGEDETPLFTIDGYSRLSSEESPFESVDAEITFYLDGAKRIRSILEEAGVEPPSTVMINGENHQLSDSA